MTDEKIRTEAARWLAILAAGDPDSSVEEEFLAWQEADARHGAVIAAMQESIRNLVSGMQVSEKHAEHLAKALAFSTQRRRLLKGGLFLIGAVAPSAWLLSRVSSTGFVLPGDIYTRIAERASFRLQDGSEITLNASSRVLPGTRSISIRTGEAMLNVAQDKKIKYDVHTDFFVASTLSRRVLVRQDVDSAYVVALDKAVDISDKIGASYTLGPMEWIKYSRGSGIQQGRASADDTAWLQGMLIANDIPLNQVIARIQPYFSGILRVEPAVADIHISGSFTLDNPKHALRMIADVFPVRLVQRTPLWITLAPV